MNRSTRSTIFPVVALVLCGACDNERSRMPVEPQSPQSVANFSFAKSAWSEPQWLGPDVNSPERDLGPSLSPDGLSLYFNSERDGGYGGMDIWVSRRECDGCEWGAPVNLGERINSTGMDESPRVSADGHLLFFASTRDGGEGGADIYVSWRSHIHNDLAWRSPVNLGAVLNTGSHEGGPAYRPSGGGGAANFYFTRCCDGGWTDLYSAVIRIAPSMSAGPIVSVVAAPVPVSELNHPAAHTFEPSLRADGRELVFWSGPQRGGVGGADLWSSTRRSVHDPWSAPVNMGLPVNFEFADLTASLSLDGRTLVFSRGSQGGGLGRQDLWISKRTPSGW